MGGVLVFWKDKWIGDQPLNLLFPQIFSTSTHKEASLRDLWSIVDGGVFWNLTWRRQPFLWERNLIGNLLALIEGVNLRMEEDRWV